MPITTSGKIARRWCKRAYDDNTFQTLYEWRAEPDGNGNANGHNGGSGPSGGGLSSGRSGGGAGAAGDGDNGGEPPGHHEAAVDVEGWSDEELLASLVADVLAATHLEALDDPDAALVNLGADSLGLAQVVDGGRDKDASS